MSQEFINLDRGTSSYMWIPKCCCLFMPSRKHSDEVVGFERSFAMLWLRLLFNLANRTPKKARNPNEGNLELAKCGLLLQRKWSLRSICAAVIFDVCLSIVEEKQKKTEQILSRISSLTSSGWGYHEWGTTINHANHHQWRDRPCHVVRQRR